jgi:hypothetical protein
MTVWGGSEAGGRWRTWPGKNEKGLRGRGLSGSSAFASVDGRPRFAFAASSSFFCLVVLFCVCVCGVGCVEWAGWEKDRIEERERERVRARGCACVGARVRGSAGACAYMHGQLGGWVGSRMRVRAFCSLTYKGFWYDLAFGLHNSQTRGSLFWGWVRRQDQARDPC